MNPKNTLLTTILICLSVFVIAQDYWELIETPDSSFVRSFEINHDGTLFLGMGGSGAPGGIYRSFDDGQNWEYLIFNEHTAYSLEVCSNGDLLAGINYGIYKSSDNGNTWYQVFNQPDTYTPIFYVGNGLVLTGGVNVLHGIIRSFDFGETWDTSFLFTNYGDEFIRSFAVSSNGDLYAGTNNIFGPSGLYRSNDNGENWEVFNIPGEQVFGLGVHPYGDLFAGCLGDGLYRYNFNSQSWSHDLYNVTPDDFLFVGYNTIYIGCNGANFSLPGVFYSENSGETYDWLNSGMLGSGTGVKEFIVAPSGHIYLGGEFIYRSSEAIVTEINDNQTSKNKMPVNFPNPFIHTTTIKWEPNLDDHIIKIKIRDLKGKLVINNSVKNCGEYIVDGTLLLPGLFFYTIEGNNEFFSGKMLLVK